jgi:UDP-3-O-acyl N-acetylglucosamine deacetylase
MNQCTIGHRVTYSGIALHTGVRAQLAFMPAPVNTGVWFQRVDLPGKPLVQAIASNVTAVTRGTTIESGPAKVCTVEHILAALNAYGVDNVIVEMDDVEPTIADGSSLPFVEMIEKVGVVEQSEPRRVFEVDRVYEYSDGETSVRLEPHDSFKISCRVQYHETVLDKQEFSTEITAKHFRNELCEARTFCLYREIEGLMNAGLIKGGSLDNAVVIKDGVILSKDGVRYPNEIVRHKMLDIVGDIYLLGCSIRGHYIADRPGHPSNVALAQLIMRENPEFFNAGIE